MEQEYIGILRKPLNEEHASRSYTPCCRRSRAHRQHRLPPGQRPVRPYDDAPDDSYVGGTPSQPSERLDQGGINLGPERMRPDRPADPRDTTPAAPRDWDAYGNSPRTQTP